MLISSLYHSMRIVLLPIASGEKDRYVTADGWHFKAGPADKEGISLRTCLLVIKQYTMTHLESDSPLWLLDQKCNSKLHLNYLWTLSERIKIAISRLKVSEVMWGWDQTDVIMIDTISLCSWVFPLCSFY